MLEAEIILERENRDGVVAVGSYLRDALKRLGIRFDDHCQPENGVHFCAVEIRSGADRVSELTQAEMQYFADHGHKPDERLACQVRIEHPGEVVIMTRETKKEQEEKEKAAADHSEAYRKEFEELPLEKKIASLVRLEAIALGETISFVINSPFKIFEKAMDVMAEFGLKLDQQAKEAGRPEEHKAASNGKAETKAKTEKKKKDEETAQ